MLMWLTISPYCACTVRRSLRVIKLLIYQLPFSQSGYFFFALYLYSASVPEVGEVSRTLRGWCNPLVPIVNILTAKVATPKTYLMSVKSRSYAFIGYLGLYSCLFAYARILRTQKLCVRKSGILASGLRTYDHFQICVRKKLNFLRTKANSWYSCLPCVCKVYDCNALVHWTFTPTQKLAYRGDEHE